MHLTKVISYKKAWETVELFHKQEANEVLEAMDSVFSRVKTNRYEEGIVILYNALLARGWNVIHNKGVGIGPVKNKLSVTIGRSSNRILHFLFQQAGEAIKRGLIDIPIISTFTQDVGNFADNRITPVELYEDILNRFTPTSNTHPFLILGYSDSQSDLVINELPDFNSDFSKVIDKSIQFPPEYHQAGLSILNYFATYLRENYPFEQAKVKIEQEGFTVRLIVETYDGNAEIIEKALHEYQLIVRSEEPPEKFTNNPDLVLGLKNKLEIAKVELRMQQNIISMQNNKIEKLIEIIGDGLSSRNLIDFRPTITVSNEVNVSHQISFALGSINELKDLVEPTSEVYSKLKELETSLERIENEKSPDVVKKSGAMSKFKRFVESVNEGNSDIQKAIKAVEGGWEIFKELGGKYNSIAQWCGLPQIPKIFTK